MNVEIIRPTRAQQLAAYDTFVPDLIGPNLRVLFSGINPSLYSAAVGHHFARPGNRFWPALIAKVKKHRPTALAILGVGAYRIAFNEPLAVIGRQEKGIGDTLVWVLPNPSGLNAHYQPTALAKAFEELRRAIE